MIACTSQNAGVPVDAFAGTGFDEMIEAPEIETAPASALHASCPETMLDAIVTITATIAKSASTVERWLPILMMDVSVQLLPCRQRGWRSSFAPSWRLVHTTAMQPTPLPSDVTARAMLRHLAATLAYRAAKVLRDVPPEFASASFGGTTRHPVQIVAHLADLMAWAITLARGDYVWKAEGSDNWGVEVTRFFDNLAALDRELMSEAAFTGSIERLIQGPLADALTHVGQLAMLRGIAGVPVRPESYARAEIVAGRVGPAQAPPGREFDGDASTRFGVRS
jgi:hypothetical protein